MRQSKKELESKLTREIVRAYGTNRASSRKRFKNRVRNCSPATAHPRVQEILIKNKKESFVSGMVRNAGKNEAKVKRILKAIK